MRRRLLGQMMAVTLRQLSASTSSILIWGSVWGFPSIIEISVRKFKIRLKVLIRAFLIISTLLLNYAGTVFYPQFFLLYRSDHRK
jgi:hypothetical protein